MNKILSVVVPTYNMEALLERCLNSFIVNDAGMEQLEVIVVNDGSKDRSSAIAHEYENRYPQTFKVIDKENGNYGSCVNRALKEATGKYFKICDADDRYETASLEEFIHFLDAAQSDIVFSPFKILDFDSNEISSLAPAERYLNRTLDIEDVDWGSAELSKYRAMHAMCTRTDILRDNHYKQTEGISYTDTEFIFYSVLYSRTCSFFPRPIYLYCLGRDGQTMSPASMIKSNMHFYKNAKRMLDTYILLPKQTGEKKQQLLFESIMACIAYFMQVSLIHIRKNGEQIKLYKGLILESKESLLPCPIEDKLLQSESRYFKLWKRYNIPHYVIYYGVKVKQFCRNFRKNVTGTN